MADKLYELTAHELSDMLQSRQVSAREVTQSFLDRIDAVDKSVKAYITTTPEAALAQAQAVDDAIGRGEAVGALAGIPGGIKDNVCTYGVLTTCASKMLTNFTPVYDATVAARLNNAGAVMTGKTNLDEFATGSSTENSACFTTHNPWNLKMVPGGSSGGSAAAVAADECAFALGTDTAGSVRQPASFCGVVGFKPTYGLVSRYGVTSLASSLDQVGPITKDVSDCAMVLNAIVGKDRLDGVTLDIEAKDFTKALAKDVAGLRIGVAAECFGPEIDADVEKAVRAAIDLLIGLGASSKEIALPHLRYGIQAYSIIAAVESSSTLARFDGVRFGVRSKHAGDATLMSEKTREEGFGLAVKQRLILGTHLLTGSCYDEYFIKAQKIRTLIIRDFEKAFEECDIIISPTCPTVAFEIGEYSDNPLAMRNADACTVHANLVGIPSISVPCGFKDGLPIGLQITGKHLDDETLLRVAYTYEQTTDWHKRKPQLI